MNHISSEFRDFCIKCKNHCKSTEMIQNFSKLHGCCKMGVGVSPLWGYRINGQVQVYNNEERCPLYLEFLLWN